MLLGVPVALGLAWYAWRNRRLPGALPFLCVLPLAALWSLASAGELLAPALDDKFIWSNLQYVAKAFVPVAWLAVLLDYAGYQAWLRPRRLAVLCIVPLVTTALFWTNDLHHLMRLSAVADRRTAWWRWWDSRGASGSGSTCCYSYALITAAVILMISVCCSSPPLYRRQPLALLAGSAIPIAVHMAFIFSEQFDLTWDYTPIGFTFGGVVIAWGLFRMRLFNLAPVARHALVEDMTDGVLVLDGSDRVVDLNNVGGRPHRRDRRRRSSAGPWWRSGRPGRRWPRRMPAETSHAELRLGDDGETHHYEVKWSPVRRHRRHRRPSGGGARRHREGAHGGEPPTAGPHRQPHRATQPSLVHDADWTTPSTRPGGTTMRSSP